MNTTIYHVVTVRRVILMVILPTGALSIDELKSCL